MFRFILSRTFVFIGVNSWLNSALIALLIVDLTSCATTSTHQFPQPARDWQTRTGQLLYRNPKTTVIGDVIVRFSRNGDFELTFSKGPGVNLLFLRQDSTSAEIKGPLAGRGWSGPIDGAPQQLRGWLGLRDTILHPLAAARPSAGGRARPQVHQGSGS